ncbi:MAG: hypothetical protein KDD16_03435 [Mangrovimonas sp.]|nr:hypothetical protein [Mangrovimonas sp.]
MKKTLLITVFLAITTFVNAQNRDKLKALKIAFITERLDLTQSEAQKFWPIYNAFEEKEREFRRDNFMERRNLKWEDLTEEDAQKLIDDFIKNEDEMHAHRQKFIADLRKVLPAKKIILLKKTEDDFKQEMLEQYKMRRGGGRP